jgi:hypothetical protein
MALLDNFSFRSYENYRRWNSTSWNRGTFAGIPQCLQN